MVCGIFKKINVVLATKYADDEVSKLVNKKGVPSNFKVSSEEGFNDDSDNYFDWLQISSSEDEDTDDNDDDDNSEKDKVKKDDEEEDFFIDVNDI